MKIRTNNKPRHVIYGFELSNKERQEFDYYTGEELDNATFFRYKGNIYDVGEFMRCPDSLAPWHGYSSDSYFSGVVVKIVDNGESVIVGQYFS
jgi:ribosomal protein L30E